jgi:hypothetical protein
MNARFEQAIALIDAENAQDPNADFLDGKPVPRELLYSQRLTNWILRLNPNASEALRLAARSQHICRWKIPRSQYPATRPGYHGWKNDLKRFHADLTSSILESVGYEEEMIARVHSLNLKQGFPADPECRTLEDALCLMFLEFQFGELAQKATPEKIINALRKSWAKMTPQAREVALRLRYSDSEKALLHAALEPHQVTS